MYFLLKNDEMSFKNVILLGMITYPTDGKGKASSEQPLMGIC